jgi:hypothetical protein
VLSLQVGGNLGLGSVSVGQKLLLVVEKLLSSLGGVFDVRSLSSGHIKVSKVIPQVRSVSEKGN